MLLDKKPETSDFKVPISERKLEPALSSTALEEEKDVKYVS